MLPSAGLDSEFTVPADLPDLELDALVRQNLYLIFKEAVHNAVKHARAASVIGVRVGVAEGRLELEVRNDGAPVTAPGRATGHGLRNIRMRATDVGGEAVCERLPEGGFRVWAWVPV